MDGSTDEINTHSPIGRLLVFFIAGTLPNNLTCCCTSDGAIRLLVPHPIICELLTSTFTYGWCLQLICNSVTDRSEHHLFTNKFADMPHVCAESVTECWLHFLIVTVMQLIHNITRKRHLQEISLFSVMISWLKARRNLMNGWG